MVLGPRHEATRNLQAASDEPGRLSAADISLEIATDLATIKALEKDWNELEQRTPEATGFQSFWWCCGWIESTCSSAPRTPKPLVLVVREGRRTVWLLPLQVEKRYGVRWARALGQPVTQYADALAIAGPRRAVWRAAADEALRSLGQVDVVCMIQVRADSVLAKVQGSSIVRSTSRAAPYLDLTDEAAVSESLALRGSLRRRHRVLARMAPVSFDLASGREDPPDAVRHALQLKREWLRARRLHGYSFVAPPAGRFLERLAASGHIEVHRLRIGANLSAFDIGFVDKTVYRSLVSAYDLRYAYGAPGHHLTRSVIEHCRSRGLKQFDLFAPAEPYKRAISSGSIDIVSIHDPLTTLGRAGMFASLKLRRPFYKFNEWRDRFLLALLAAARRTFKVKSVGEGANSR